MSIAYFGRTATSSHHSSLGISPAVNAWWGYDHSEVRRICTLRGSLDICCVGVEHSPTGEPMPWSGYHTSSLRFEDDACLMGE